MIKARNGLAERRVAVLDRKDRPLSVCLGDTVRFTRERVMGVEFPALVDQVIIVRTVVSNKVAVLVGRIVDTRRTILVLLVDIIEIGESVLLRIVPPIIGPTRVVIFVLGSQINVACHAKVVIGHAKTRIRCDAVRVRVQGHLELAVLLRSHARVDGRSTAGRPNVKAVFIRHVRHSSPCHDILVIINRPQVLGDLFNKLVKLLAIDTEQLPFGIRAVAIEVTGRFIAKVLVILISLVVWIDILRRIELAWLCRGIQSIAPSTYRCPHHPT